MAFPEGEVSDWMLADDGFPLWFSGHESRTEMFLRELRETNEATQKKLKYALVQAISRWDPEAHSAEILGDLASIAGYLQVERALPGLIQIIDNKVPLPRDEESQMLRAHVISSVSVFPKQEIAKSALKRWYADGSFDWRCTEIICFGLIEGDPDNAQSLLSQLLTTIDDPNYFDNPGLTTSNLVSFIKPDELERILNEIGTKSAKQLLSGMPIAREIEAELGRS